MWILFAVGSSFFAGITAILAKCGIRKTDSDVATAIRTVVVLLFAWLMVLVTGAWFSPDLQPAHPGCVISERCRKGISTRSYQ